MIQLLKDLASAVASALGLLRKNQELKNSPQMQANARAKIACEIQADATSAVARNDLDEIRKQAAE
jgi:hypothetical protein